MQHRTLLEYKGYRYLKTALSLAGLALAAYLLQRSPTGNHGGTWLGYTLGTIAALLVLLLLWLGVRKRQYLGPGTMQGWLSAHVYLGLALVIVATLHSGFQYGWNVHTLSYFLLLAVVGNGLYGLYAYIRFPRLMTENLGEDNLDSLLLKIADLDGLARTNAMQLPDEINDIVHRASRDTRIGGGVFEQLIGHQRDCPTADAVRRLHTLGKNLKGIQPKLHRELYSIMLRREALVGRARKDIMYKARLEFWLYWHIPLSFGLLVTLAAHVIAIFFYW